MERLTDVVVSGWCEATSMLDELLRLVGDDDEAGHVGAAAADSPRASRAVPSNRQVIQAVLGDAVRIRDVSPYIEACVHSSAAAQIGCSQERLEFLGDAILYAATSRLLHARFPHADEGALSRLRTKLVTGRTLAHVGRHMQLERVVKFGPMLTFAEGMIPDKVYEDTYESLIGAVHVDQGFEAAVAFIAHTMRAALPAEVFLLEDNYKEVLRRYALRAGVAAPKYTSEQRGGEQHSTCTCAGVEAHASAPRRKQAEASAAREVLCIIGFDVLLPRLRRGGRVGGGVWG